MKPFLFPLMLTISLGAAAPALSQDVTFKSTGMPVTLVELYSSEGCSSCPPAEEWVSRWRSSPRLWSDIFPVVFHVDYWDGLGWPDRFARPDYTERQRNYAARLGQDSVYTPEFVANGREWRGFFDGGDLPAASLDTGGQLTVTSHDGGKSVSVDYVPKPATAASSFRVNVALLGFNVVSDVKRGENGGRQLRHDFVVLGFVSRALAPGKAGGVESGPLAITPSTDDPPMAVVAWISRDDGSPVQVAGGWLRKDAVVTAR